MGFLQNLGFGQQQDPAGSTDVPMLPAGVGGFDLGEATMDSYVPAQDPKKKKKRTPGQRYADAAQAAAAFIASQNQPIKPHQFRPIPGLLQ